MRLHTDFHDYYDNAVDFGIDENVHYNRFTKEVEITIKSKTDFPPPYLETHLLEFCGRTYPIVSIHKFSRSIYSWENYYEEDLIVEIFYAYSIEEGEKKAREWGEFSRGSGCSNNREFQKLRQFFIDWGFESDEVFLEYKAPTWVVKLETNGTFGLLNPKLKDYGFDRIKNSFPRVSRNLDVFIEHFGRTKRC